MSYDTIQWQQSGGIGRITLNRPETLNAWTTEFGAELKEAVNEDAADPSVRAVLITGAGRGFSSGADLKAGFEPAPRGRHAERGTDAARGLPPDHRRHPRAGEAGGRRGQRPGCRDRAVARARVRPRPRRRVGLLRPRIREHRADARRRLDAVRARGRRARRAPTRWRCSANGSKPSGRSTGG